LLSDLCRVFGQAHDVRCPLYLPRGATHFTRCTAHYPIQQRRGQQCFAVLRTCAHTRSCAHSSLSPPPRTNCCLYSRWAKAWAATADWRLPCCACRAVYTRPRYCGPSPAGSTRTCHPGQYSHSFYSQSQAARRVHMIADPAATTPHPAINEGNGHALYCSGGHAS